MTIALALSVIRLLKPFFYYADGPDQSLLPDGHRVVVFSDVDAQTSVESSGEAQAFKERTRCVVVVDYAGDQDDCFDTRRRVGVRVCEGPHKAKVVTIPRNHLRVQGWLAPWISP
jgi:hypothetical protein